MKAFRTTTNKEHEKDGFQITFENKYTISVIFGKYTFSDQGETTAEVAAWNKDGNWVTYSEGKWLALQEGSTEVMSHCTADEVAEMMFTLSKE
jgi:hypothetical protein